MKGLFSLISTLQKAPLLRMKLPCIRNPIKAKINVFVLSVFSLVTSILLPSCDFSPELHLKEPTQQVTLELPLVITDMEAIWQIEGDWKKQWLYGWDERDQKLWGNIEYPQPHYFQIRRYYLGKQPDMPFISFDAFDVSGLRFSRRYNFGYYNLLIFSEIESIDGTQVVIFDQSDPSDIRATTSVARVRNGQGSADGGDAKILNHPEIFYSLHHKNLFISEDPDDYDFFDQENNLLIKKINVSLSPMVYIYLVQVVLHNNHGRVDDITEFSSLSGLADGVSLHSGQTSNTDVELAFPTRMKKGLTTDDGEVVDVIGGKLHSFGLCDIGTYEVARSSQYEGSRSDLDNKVNCTLQFSNSAKKNFTFDVTDQMRSQARGGIITVHVDVDTISIPSGSPGSGFVPNIGENTEEVIVNIPF